MNKISMAILILLIGFSIGNGPNAIGGTDEIETGFDNSPLDDTVHICGIVTAGTDIFFGGSIEIFFVENSSEDQNIGFMVYCNNPDAIPTLISGDSLCFDATANYSWPNNEVPWYFIFPGSLNLFSSGNALPEPMTITAAMIDSTGNADSLAAQYASCLVRIDDVRVDSVIVYSSTSIWICHDETSHRFLVREASDSIDYVPASGDYFEYVKGILYYRNGIYNLQPVYMQDIGFLDGPAITNAGHSPENPTSRDTITFSCEVTDDGQVVRVNLNYRLNLGAFMHLAMDTVSSNSYYIAIPPLASGTQMDYCIEAEDDEGNITHWPDYGYITIIIDDPIAIDEQAQLPSATTLNQNYPNPFNSSTAIPFALTEPSYASLIIYDILGREIRTLSEGFMQAGSYEMKFDSSDLPSGMYFYCLKTNSSTITKRMLILK